MRPGEVLFLVAYWCHRSNTAVVEALLPVLLPDMDAAASGARATDVIVRASSRICRTALDLNLFVNMRVHGSIILTRPGLVDRDLLAQRVRAAREGAGLTQAQLAEISGVSNETVSRLERAAFDPTLGTAAAIAESLGLTLDGLVAGGEQAQSGGGSPTVAKLAKRAELLAPAAQRSLLQLAEMLPVASPNKSR